MKKLLRLVLTLALTLSLAAPVAAYEGGENSADTTIASVEAYKAAHPEEVAAFDANAWFHENLSDFLPDGKAGYMRELNLTTQEEFADAVLLAYIQQQFRLQDYKDQWAALQAAEPERTAQFLAELEHLLVENYDVLGIEHYMAAYDWYESVEEAYLALYYGWNAEYDAAQQAIADRDAFLVQRGGVPGALNVMLDGQYLSFPQGRAPYAEGGVTYAHAATLTEVLGVDIPATADGYVSLRAAAEEAHLWVFWDKEYQSVVLLDTAALTRRLDEDFTIFNDTLAKWRADFSKNYKVGTSVKADVTLFDSLDGDKSGSVSCDWDTLLSAEGMQMTGKYDMTGLMRLLLSATAAEAYAPDADTLALVKAALKGDFAYRMDFEQAVAYMKGSIFDLLYEQSFGEKAPRGTWISVSQEGLDIDALLTDTPTTYGGLVVSQMETWRAVTTPVLYYDVALDTATSAAPFGDARFVKEGRNHQLTLGREDLEGLLTPLIGYGSDLDRCELTLTVGPDGGLSGTGVLRVSGYYDSSATLISADFDLSPAKQQLTLEVHGRNAYLVNVTMTGTTGATAERPALTPPDDAYIVE